MVAARGDRAAARAGRESGCVRFDAAVVFPNGLSRCAVICAKNRHGLSRGRQRFSFFGRLLVSCVEIVDDMRMHAVVAPFRRSAIVATSLHSFESQ